MNEFEQKEERQLEEPVFTAQDLHPNYNTYQHETLIQESIKKRMIDFFKDRNNTIIAIWLSIFIGVVFSFLIVEYKLRLNVFIFYVFLLATTGYIMHKDGNLAVRPFVFFSVTFLAIASVFMRYSYPGYIAMGTLLLPVVYVLLTVYCSKQKYTSDIKAVLFRGVCSIGFVHMIVVAIGSLKRKDNKKKTQYLHILIGIGITIVLLAIIIPLMLSADEMFRVKLNDMFGQADIGMFILKSIIAAFISMMFFGFIYIITVHRHKEKIREKTVELPSITTIILTIITALAIVFTFFAVVQFSYLFVGATSDLPEGFSPAEYARNGYFQLVVLSALNFAIILSCIFFSKKGNTQAKRVMKIILAYFNGLNIYLLVSAAYKMRLYQNEFGLTTSRLLVYILLLFEAVLILGLMAKIFIQNMKFVKLAVFFSVAFLAAVSFINVEAAALKYNINNLYSQDKLDFEYIEWQSPDASQVLFEFYMDNNDTLSEDERYSIEHYFGVKDCERDLRTAAQYDSQYSQINWREFNISESDKHYRGKMILEQINQ